MPNNIRFEKDDSKISLPVIMLSVCIIFIFIINSPSFFITRYYIPFFFPTLFVSIIYLFKQKIIFKTEHFCILTLLLITIFNLNKTVNFIDLNSDVRDIKYILVLFSSVLFFFTFTLHDFNLQELKLITNSFIVSGLLLSIYIFTFHEIINGRYMLKPFLGVSYEYIDTNYVSAFLLLPCIILLKRVLLSKKYIIINFIFFLFILLAILFSGSRAAMLAILIAFTILLSRYKKKTLIYLFIFLISIFIIKEILPVNLQERLFFKTYIDNSNINRLSYWQTSFFLTLENYPLSGYGIINSQYVVVIGKAHNSLLSFFVQFGFLGVFAILVLFIKIFKHTLEKDMTLFFAILIASSVVYMAIEAITSITFWLTILFLVSVVNFKLRNPRSNLWNEV